MLGERGRVHGRMRGHCAERRLGHGFRQFTCSELDGLPHEGLGGENAIEADVGACEYSGDGDKSRRDSVEVRGVVARNSFKLVLQCWGRCWV